ncbi:motility associated factor glycosyltransferase family protein [Leptospira sp. 'Mane']|uniref:motility associated factor glycosyltransferase family protein n=1 Tax=Leptospira sp. 'Mane' TaxID=3387407 RepID=UPI00398B2DA9
MDQNLLEKNLASLPDGFAEEIRESEILSPLQKTKSEDWTIELDGIFLHSKHDPKKEAGRLAIELPDDNEKRVYLLFGAGLGYIVPEILKKPTIDVVWMEPHPFLLKIAFSLFDFSSAIASEKLIIVLHPTNEDEMAAAFKGKATTPITFVPHRSSWAWRESEYAKLRSIAEQTFHKKDVNLATLTRFEKIWAKNICFNLFDLIHMKPVSLLFGLAKDAKVLVVSAGPSLYESIEEIIRYRDHFVMIAVDTALPILDYFKVKPDLVYSVDPQALNSQYLESHTGGSILVFDPTSTYISLRLEAGPKKGFFTSSPFPMIKVLEEAAEKEIGYVPFGGSVSTNAASLATLMESKATFLIGQDLSFTKGWAHSKGAIMEERLNYKESRRFRRELHNYRQLSALPPKKVKGKNGEDHLTNEKMLIFKKWFESQAKDNNWINLTKNGANLEGIPNEEFNTSFADSDKLQATIVRKQIRKLADAKSDYIPAAALEKKLNEIIGHLNEFSIPVKRGLDLSKKLYAQIKTNQIHPQRFQEDLHKMDLIDEMVSGKKGLNEILSLGIQRTILTITEGYEDQLSLEERENEQLGIAKKSVLLYEGLFESLITTKKNLKKTLYRLTEKQSL